ncbi:MarR family transcriptional regulator [Candidatus Woesearchaeota archaeon]|nr:MarR family transcriptional regulator [Candidatus Woesearchaeota archaeon]
MRIGIFALLLVLLSVSSYAQLYADVVFDISDNGDVKITGNTNYDAFSGITNELTFKEGKNWTFILSTPVFDEYVYSVKLPKNAKFSFVESDSQTKIEEENGRLIVTAAGIEKEILMIIEYTIETDEKTKTALYYLIGLVILAFAAFAVKKYSKPSRKLDRNRFTDRQWEIVSYLQKHGIVTQAELEKELKLPKSSLSRNIETLVQKGVVFRETKGMSNAVGLK